MYKIKCWIIILILILVSLLITTINFTGGNYKKNIPSNNNNITYKIKHSITMIYDLEGRLNYRLIAEQIEHCAKRKISWITQPRLIIYDTDKIPTWSIKSDHAKLVSNHMLHLCGHVKVNTMVNDSQLCKITTNNAKINLITQDIISQGQVNLYGVTFNSSGLEIRGNLRKKNAMLIGNVRTFYKIQNNQNHS